MNIEYAEYDIASNENEIKNNISKSLKYKPYLVSVLPYHIKNIKSILPENIKISTPIDYPCGILDIKSRICAAENAIKCGASVIDVVVPSHYLCNRKYDKFREDVKNFYDICSQNNVELRYILEYRIYSYELLYKICQILFDNNIFSVIPSTGFRLDDLADNIIASALIQKKNNNLNIVCNGNIWNKKHLELIVKSKISNIRVHSLNSLDLLTNKKNDI